MSMDLGELGLDRLSRDEKLEIVGQLWNSILTSDPPGASLTVIQREELQRRIADAKANPEDYVTWEDALSATLGRLAQ